jgi:ankyrin repeat protein
MKRTFVGESRCVLCVCSLMGILVVGLMFHSLQRDKPRLANGQDGTAELSSREMIPSAAAREQVLRDAAREGRIQVVSVVLAQGTDPNVPDEDGRTALMLAAYNGSTDIVRLLIGKGAPVNAQDGAGRTALMYAASGPNYQTVQLLLDNQADPNVADRAEGWTALMFAAAEGQADVVQTLLRYGADATLRDVDGESARDFAINNGHAKIVQMLESDHR